MPTRDFNADSVTSEFLECSPILTLTACAASFSESAVSTCSINDSASVKFCCCAIASAWRKIVETEFFKSYRFSVNSKEYNYSGMFVTCGKWHT